MAAATPSRRACVKTILRTRSNMQQITMRKSVVLCCAKGVVGAPYYYCVRFRRSQIWNQGYTFNGEISTCASILAPQAEILRNHMLLFPGMRQRTTRNKDRGKLSTACNVHERAATEFNSLLPQPHVLHNLSQLQRSVQSHGCLCPRALHDICFDVWEHQQLYRSRELPRT